MLVKKVNIDEENLTEEQLRLLMEDIERLSPTCKVHEFGEWSEKHESGARVRTCLKCSTVDISEFLKI